MDRDVADVIKEGVKSLNRVSVVCNRSFRWLMLPVKFDL
jgi:hypothetical protein